MPPASSWLILLALLSSARAAPDPPAFEQEDPVRWARTQLAPGPEQPGLLTLTAREPLQLPLRKPDGTIWLPEAAFPDAALADPVLAAVDRYLALPQEAPREEFERRFIAVADAALAWGRWIIGPSPLPSDEAATLGRYQEIQDRLVLTGVAPPFHEFTQGSGLGEGSLSDYVGCSEGRWEVTGPGRGNVIAMTIDGALRDPRARELVRIHEWAHALDYARLGLVDQAGRQIRPLTSRAAFFSEAKSYSLTYLLRRRREPFARFLLDLLSGYYWARPRGGYRLEIGELRPPATGRFLRDVRYLRTVAPTHPAAR